MFDREEDEEGHDRRDLRPHPLDPAEILLPTGPVTLEGNEKKGKLVPFSVRRTDRARKCHGVIGASRSAVVIPAEGRV